MGVTGLERCTRVCFCYLVSNLTKTQDKNIEGWIGQDRIDNGIILSFFIGAQNKEFKQDMIILFLLGAPNGPLMCYSTNLIRLNLLTHSNSPIEHLSPCRYTTSSDGSTLSSTTPWQLRLSSIGLLNIGLCIF